MSLFPRPRDFSEKNFCTVRVQIEREQAEKMELCVQAINSLPIAPLDSGLLSLSDYVEGLLLDFAEAVDRSQIRRDATAYRAARKKRKNLIRQRKDKKKLPPPAPSPIWRQQRPKRPVSVTIWLHPALLSDFRKWFCAARDGEIEAVIQQAISRADLCPESILGEEVGGDEAAER
jgi:hypothetical protein